MYKEPFLILMAEDSEHDIIATRRVWKKSRIANPLFIVKDGEECLDFLYHRGRYNGDNAPPHPGVLLLDVHMPKMDGISVLKYVRNDGPFRRLPIIVMTSSEAHEDRLRSYDLGANAYIVKPVGFDNLSNTLMAVNLFWEAAALPETRAWYKLEPSYSLESSCIQKTGENVLLSVH